MPAPAGKSASLSRKRRRKQKGASTLPLLPPEIGEDELEISEEDVEFVKKHRKYAGFISNLDTNSITRHVMGIKPEWEGEGLEKLYESKGKKFQEDENIGFLVVDPADALPVKTLEGQLHYRSTVAKEKENTGRTIGNGAARVVPTTTVRSGEADEVDGVGRSLNNEIGVETSKNVKDVKKKQKEKHDDKRSVGLASSQDLKELDVYVSKEERRANTKSHIAELGTKLLENPEENLSALKELMDMCADSDKSISQLAMLSLMAIFKDLVPGYRIRLPTAKELETQVSKEVQKLRDYESTLLRSYQRYVQMLIKSQKSHSRQKASLRCMCGLLEAIPHFNYRDNLLAAVIRCMNSPDAACRIMSRDAIQSLFKNEGKHGGEATVEAVQMIADLVKLKNCLLHPAVLEVFACLSFEDDLVRSTDTRPVGSTGRKDDKRFDPKFISKHQGKKDKKAKKQLLANELTKELESDFKEASAQPDLIERKKLQTTTLSAVFETYFRVLKSTESPPINRIKDLKVATPLTKGNELGDHPLLGVVLEGLTQFTQLISVEYLGDLLRLLCKLVGGGDSTATQQECQSNLTVDERLHCCIVAFKIVRNNLGALNVDLREFYVHFYNLLLEYKPLSDHQSDLLLAKALHAILLEGRQHDMQRVAAFVKRLAGVCLSLGSAAAMSVLVAVQQLIQKNKQCRNMLENDGGGGAVGGTIAMYQPFALDPDLSGALSSILWELNLLGKHYHPAVAKLATQISNMASAEFVPATMTALDAITSYSTEQGGFRPAVQLPRKISKKRAYKSCSSSLIAASERGQVQGGLEITFGSHFRLLKEFRDNEILRKELTRTRLKLDLYKEYRHGKKMSRPIKLKKNMKEADLKTSK